MEKDNAMPTVIVRISHKTLADKPKYKEHSPPHHMPYSKTLKNNYKKVISGCEIASTNNCGRITVNKRNRFPYRRELEHTG